MSTVDASRPKVLRKLVIDEFSFVDAPASIGSDVLVWKRDSGDGGGAAGTAPAAATGNLLPLGDRLAKLEADIAAARANRRADEALEALAKRDMPQATELLGDPDTYHAYSARVRGQEGRPPVAKAAGLDHCQAIRKAVAEDDFAELDRLCACPTAAGSTRRRTAVAGIL
jgi:hypothetical protein